MKKIKQKKYSEEKKDSVGLFSGKFKSQEFADKKDKLKKISQKEKQKGYSEDKEL